MGKTERRPTKSTISSRRASRILTWQWVFLLGILPSFGQSFDCTAPQYPDDKTICSNAMLGVLEVHSTLGYVQALKKSGAKLAKPAAIRLLNERRTCGVDAGCIERNLRSAIQTFREMGATVASPELQNLSDSDAKGASDNAEASTSPAADSPIWTNMWRAASQKPFDFLVLCYGSASEAIVKNLANSVSPADFEDTFVVGGGNGHAMQLAFQVCDPQVRRLNLFDDPNAFQDAKITMAMTAAELDKRMLSQCTTPRCKEIAKKAFGL